MNYEVFYVVQIPQKLKRMLKSNYKLICCYMEP